jgi:hypothetical protein
MVSSPSATPSREEAKPALSRTTTASFPSPSTKSTAVASVVSPVCSATTASTRSTRCAGSKKWSSTARSGRSRTLASSVTDSDEMFEATMPPSARPPPRPRRRPS